MAWWGALVACSELAAQACQLPFAMRRPCESSGPRARRQLLPKLLAHPAAPDDSQAYDKFTLGADVSAGDSVKVSNPLLTMAFQDSFEPRADETSRVVAGVGRRSDE